jgi:hypothetical protein
MKSHLRNSTSISAAIVGVMATFAAGCADAAEAQNLPHR